MAAADGELVEVRFRLHDGSDIGPIKFAPAATVVELKESVVARWPSGGATANSDADAAAAPSEGDGKAATVPQSYREIKLINCGRVLDDSKTLAESRVPMGEVAGAPITMHVVVRPPGSSEKRQAEQKPADAASTRCGCTIQ